MTRTAAGLWLEGTGLPVAARRQAACCGRGQNSSSIQPAAGRSGTHYGTLSRSVGGSGREDSLPGLLETGPSVEARAGVACGMVSGYGCCRTAHLRGLYRESGSNSEHPMSQAPREDARARGHMRQLRVSAWSHQPTPKSLRAPGRVLMVRRASPGWARTRPTSKLLQGRRGGRRRRGSAP